MTHANIERKRCKRQKGQIYVHNQRIQALETISKNSSIGSNNRSNENTKGNALGPFEKTNRKPGGELVANRWRIGGDLVANWWRIGGELGPNSPLWRGLQICFCLGFATKPILGWRIGGELVANWWRIGAQFATLAGPPNMLLFRFCY